MKKQYVYGVDLWDEPADAADTDVLVGVYLASDVDAREAQGTAVIKAQRERIAELEQALGYAIRNGVTYSKMRDVFDGDGCGCCSEELQVPTEINVTLRSVL